MTLAVQVVWAGADGSHGLLPDKHANVSLDIDGSVVQGAPGTKGQRDFTIPAGAQTVTLTAKFDVEFGAVNKAPAMKETVLEATQRYAVTKNGTALEAELDGRFMGPHPLVQTVSASGAAGATVIRIVTDFVDITKFWFAYANFAGDHIAERHPNTALLALGCTKGTPLIWFASISDQAIVPPNSEISCLTFFRPANYKYTRVDEKHDMFGLNRYLLPPVLDPAAPDYKREKFMQTKKKKEYIWIRAGFENAMVNSRRPLVMLHPWPSQASFGKASSSELPALANAAIRLLWAMGEVADGRRDVKLGRLGVAGYSAGGLGMWGAVRNNQDRISEIYSFDARSTSTNAALAAHWFRKDAPNRRLRMSSGYNIATHVGIKRTIEQATKQAQPNVTAVPASRNDYKLGANPLWDETTSTFPQRQMNSHYWHAFAIFGAMGSPPLTAVPNFMEQFLLGSDF